MLYPKFFKYKEKSTKLLWLEDYHIYSYFRQNTKESDAKTVETWEGPK